MKKIGAYFGSFNPIHNGHIAIAKAALEQGGFDQVWLIVSPQNPLKKASDLLDDKTRYELTRLSVLDIEGIEASDIEFSLQKPSYTFETLIHLKNTLPDHQFSLIIGGDNLAIFDHWRNYDKILANFPLVVYPRPEYELKDFAGAQITIIQAPLHDISSTQIRENIKFGKSIYNLVPQHTEYEIKKSGLYL